MISRLYPIRCQPFSKALSKQLVPVWRHLLLVAEVADHTDRVIIEASFDDENGPGLLLASPDDPFAYKPLLTCGIDFPFVMYDIERRHPQRFDPALIGEYDPVVDNWIRASILQSWDLAQTKALRKEHLKRGRRFTIFTAQTRFQRMDGLLEPVAGSKPAPLTSLPHQLIQLAGQDAFSIFVVEDEVIVELDLSCLTNDRLEIVSQLATLVGSLDKASKSFFAPKQIVVPRDADIPEKELKRLKRITGAKKVSRVTERQARSRHHKRWFPEPPDWLIPFSDYSPLE